MYGYTVHNQFEDGKVITMDGSMFVNPMTYYKLKSLEIHT